MADYEGFGSKGKRHLFTSQSGFFTGQDIQSSTDGQFTTGTAWYWGGSGAYLRWDFGWPVAIDAFKWYQDGSTVHGDFDFQGSNDASTWTTIIANLSLGANGGSGEYVGSNTTRYRYYQLARNSGSASSGPYLYETEFRRDGVWFAIETGDRQAIITTSTDVAGTSGGLDKTIDGDPYAKTGQFYITSISAGEHMTWDFDTETVELEGFAVHFSTNSTNTGYGTWQPQYWDGAAWQDHESPLALGTAVNDRVIHLFGSPTPPTTGFRLEYVSGTIDINTWFTEIEFLPVPASPSLEELISVSFGLGFDLSAQPATPEVSISAAMGLGFDLSAVPTDVETKFISAAFGFGFDAAVLMDVPDFYSDGPRETFITVTTNLDTFEGSPSNLVDGAFGLDASDALGIGLNDLSIAPGDFFVQFELAEQKIFSGLKLLLSSGANGGEWQWQGSDDGSSWTDISTPFTISGAGGASQSFSLPNSTPYFFYRMLSVDGFINDAPYWLEFEFSVDGETILTLLSVSFDLGLNLDPQQFVEPPKDVQVLILASGR